MQGMFRAGRLKPAQKPALSTAIQNGMACGGFQSVITGASKDSQVSENMKSLDFVEILTPDVMERIETILGNKPEPFSDYR